MRGSRRWFTVEAKSFEILVEGVGRRKQYFIIEKSKGGISWIRFGEGSLGTLWKGVSECCRKEVPYKWRIEWREEKRFFSLESRKNKAGCFLLCEVRDEEGKKHSLIFPEGKDKKKGWENLVYKLNELGINDKKEEKSIFQAANIKKDRRSFANVVKFQRSNVNTIWVDAGASDLSSTWGKLNNSLVGSWKQVPDFIPSTRELESWARAVWKLKGGVSVVFLNKDLMLFEFDFLEESNYAMERGCNLFRGGVLNLERWRPESGCVKNKNLRKEAWVRVLGLPLHLWTRETLKHIGDGCGGFLKVEEESGLGSEISWVRILVRLQETVRPSTVNILASSRSYELQIWWELQPWVAEVYPSKTEDAEGLQKRRKEDEYHWRVSKGASSRSDHIKADWRAGMIGEMMGRQSSDTAACFPRKVSDHHMGCWVEQANPTVGISSNAGPDVLSPAGVGSSPIEGSEHRPNGKPTLSKGLGTGSPSFPRPDDCFQIKARSPSLQKTKLIRATDSHISSVEERYSHPTTLISPTSFCLDRFPHLEESLGHGGIDETSQASEGAEMVGFQGNALIPSAISPSSTRSWSRDSVAMEERKDQQCEVGNNDVNREAQQVGDPTCFAPASSGEVARSPRPASVLDGGSRSTKLETPSVGYLSKAEPEKVETPTVGTSPLTGEKPKPTGFLSNGLSPGCPSSSRTNDLSQDKVRIPSILHKDRAKDPLPCSDEERYCTHMPLYSSRSSPCLDRTPHLMESFGHGGPAEIPQHCVGSQGMVLTPLAILPPSTSTRSLHRELVAVEEREVQQYDGDDKDKKMGKQFLAEDTESWEESCLARFSKLLGSQFQGTKRIFWSS